MAALLRPALALVGIFTLLLGLAVPLGVTAIAALAFPHQAGGSLVTRDGRVVGSVLIGQAFTAPHYFHPRPSATTPPYNAAAAAASQLGPSSAALAAAVRARVDALGGGMLPADAVTASASGLDPHVSRENALRQVPRVAAARGLDPARVASLVESEAQGPAFGLLGAQRVNVLALNLALDALQRAGTAR